jgi:hypothetical protein
MSILIQWILFLAYVGVVYFGLGGVFTSVTT